MDVLIVDDDPGTCETFAFGLTVNGYRVRTAATGAEGIKAVRSQPYQIGLIDLKLPDMSGLDVLREFTLSRPCGVGILITGFATVGSAVEAMKLGAAEYLEKPIDLDTLIALIDKTVRRSIAARAASSAGDLKEEASHLPKQRRWAELMVCGLSTSDEVNTLEDWCRAAHVSKSTIENRCSAVHVSAKASIDLLRVLRALTDAARFHCTPDLVIDADPRTVRRLFSAVPIAAKPESGDLEQCLDRQQLVTSMGAIAALKRALRENGRLTP